MRYLFTLFVAITFGFLTSCSVTQKVAEPWSLRFENGGCMDVCKSFIIDIQSSGEFSYKGFRNVKIIGNHKGKLDSNSLSELKDLVALDWQDLEEKYTRKTHNSQHHIVKYNNHTVVYYQVTPDKLVKLEHFINKLIDTYEF